VRGSVLRYALPVCLAINACGDGSSPADAAAPSILLSISPSVLTIQKGQSDSLTLRVDRTRVGGPVVLTTTGAPAGLLVTPTPSILTGSDGILRIMADQSVAPGTYDVSVMASAAGFTTGSATCTIVVPCALDGQVGYAAPSAFVPPTGSSCKASDAATLRGCVDRLNGGTSDLLEITGPIACAPSDDCTIALSTTHPVTIFGSPGRGAGISRSGKRTMPVVVGVGTNGVTISNLVFDEDANVSCDPTQGPNGYVYPCAPTLQFYKATRVVLDRLIVSNAQFNAIAVNLSQDVTIQNSIIRNARVFGIWSGAGDVEPRTTRLRIQNNLMEDIQSNAIFLEHTDSVTIANNTLRHNHRVALFNVCNGLCSGGQIDILNNDRMRITSNQILDGRIDAGNARDQAWGIELDARQNDVLIENNEIANNGGAGIYATSSTVASNLRIVGNKLYGNGRVFVGLGMAALSGNCFTER
jgi:hypothetical protein